MTERMRKSLVKRPLLHPKVLDHSSSGRRAHTCTQLARWPYHKGRRKRGLKVALAKLGEYDDDGPK
ncbi:hypothetical protein LX32DRAFT_142955 [Colletotrichum zoysiae]|uniref:Uncharacterized protein n=1 Tax=Colletotrichum zoysiae TaxID=1216348 RepID=A0AAD9H7Z7_9PEZI|nr:hypothetical protein LX32DRAFT_142955 [Colletotrichum zoysiae]